MTFQRHYYKLEEAANDLGVDRDTIVQEAMRGNVLLSIPTKRFGKIVKIDLDNDLAIFENIEKKIMKQNITDNNNSSVPYFFTVDLNSDDQLYLLEDKKLKIKAYCIIDHSQKKDIPYISLRLNGSDEKFIYCYYEMYEREITIDDLVITFNELDRIRSVIKNHPTYDKLRAENEAFKQRIAELEAAQMQATPEHNSYKCLNRIIEIIDKFANSSEFCRYGTGTQQQDIVAWLKQRTKTRHEATHIKELITVHYGITTTRKK